MYFLSMRMGKAGSSAYARLMRGKDVALFDNIFALRKYLRRYDKSLLRITKR